MTSQRDQQLSIPSNYEIRRSGPAEGEQALVIKVYEDKVYKTIDEAIAGDTLHTAEQRRKGQQSSTSSHSSNILARLGNYEYWSWKESPSSGVSTENRNYCGNQVTLSTNADL